MIEIKSLTKLYKNKRGIRGISLEIRDGEILGLLGPNGSGKTTLMKALLSLVPDYSGEIIVDGKDLRDDLENVLERTGALIEAPSVYKRLTAHQNLRLAARRHEDEEDIDRVLDIVGLSQYKNDRAGHFSLGMKQRLGIAAAMLGTPDIIVLDEPTNGLDIESVVELREYIHRLNRENGTTFIISGHIASEIEKLCTRAAVIYEGEIIAHESIEKILSLYPSMEEFFLNKVRERRGSI